MARELGLTFTSWGMLEGGALTGKYLDESDEPRRYDDVGPKANALAREVIAVAEELGATPAQVAIAWVRAQPWHTVPIVGARTESQLRENLGALEVELAREQLDRLEAASEFRAGFPRDFLESEHVRGLIFGDTFELHRRSSLVCTEAARGGERVKELETLQCPLEHRIDTREVLLRSEVDTNVRLDREPAIVLALLALVVPGCDPDGPPDRREQDWERVGIRLDPAAGRFPEEDGPRRAIDLGGEVGGCGEGRTADEDAELPPLVHCLRAEERRERAVRRVVAAAVESQVDDDPANALPPHESLDLSQDGGRRRADGVVTDVDRATTRQRPRPERPRAS